MPRNASLSRIRHRVQDLWEFYLAYTHTGIHTAAAAALTIFGLLVFVDPLFVLVAIASYVFPPLILYVRARRTDDAPSASRHPGPGRRGEGAAVDRRRGGTDVSAETPGTGSDGRSVGTDGIETETDSDGADGDSDTDDGDTDSDTDDGDTDSDTDDGDTDSDNS